MSGLITHVQADVISVEAIPMALRQHLLQTPSVLNNKSSRKRRSKKSKQNSQQLNGRNEEQLLDDVYEEESTAASGVNLNQEMTMAAEAAMSTQTEQEEEDNEEHDDEDDDEDEEDDCDESTSNASSSLVIEPSNVLTSEDVLAMPELRDVLRSDVSSCHSHHLHHQGANRQPGDMVVLVDETYEFGECENCMDDEDEAESSNGSASGAGLDTEDDSTKIAAILGNLDRSQLESRGYYKLFNTLVNNLK